jgi:hypothetical protein
MFVFYWSRKGNFSIAGGSDLLTIINVWISEWHDRIMSGKRKAPRWAKGFWVPDRTFFEPLFTSPLFTVDLKSLVRLHSLLFKAA